MTDRAVRALAAIDPTALFGQWREIIGPPSDQLGDDAAAGLAALKRGTQPTARQMQALELAIRLLRPSVLVRDGQVETLNGPPADAFPVWETFRKTVEPYLTVVGRVDRVGGGALPAGPVATAFLIAPGLVVTNRHVVDELTLGTGRLVRGQAVIRFGQQYERGAEPPPVKIAAVHATHPDLDIAVLRLAAEPNLGDPIPLSGDTDAEDVAVVGYPLEPERVPPFVRAQFGDHFNVKRVAPGQIMKRVDDLMHHDCTTLPGNSGSPVLSLDGAHFVGVHSGGYFLARNTAITGNRLTDFLGAL
ncbi:serine protease [Actinoplanes sp. NPDC049596]|uniref:trypsin-like serine peptidase n=1 Tax=unclassified Actinoplanes TaxID=2626549 RepID=UPI003426092E